MLKTRGVRIASDGSNAPAHSESKGVGRLLVWRSRTRAAQLGRRLAVRRPAERWRAVLVRAARPADRRENLGCDRRGNSHPGQTTTDPLKRARSPATGWRTKSARRSPRSGVGVYQTNLSPFPSVRFQVFHV